jgi:hypothetical protein
MPRLISSGWFQSSARAASLSSGLADGGEFLGTATGGSVGPTVWSVSGAGELLVL